MQIPNKSPDFRGHVPSSRPRFRLVWLINIVVIVILVAWLGPVKHHLKLSSSKETSFGPILQENDQNKDNHQNQNKSNNSNTGDVGDQWGVSAPLAGDYNVVLGSPKDPVLTLVSGSENQDLEAILEEFTKDHHVAIAIKYLGSLDIMHILEQDVVPYDAVWPASSLWISVGDNQHRVKHLSSISVTPVIFGIRKSLAEELGFVDKQVTVKDILTAIQAGKLRFTMTSATQSNSGASAYIGFLYALLDHPASISMEDLHKENLHKDVQDLLKGVERSAGSSNWLVDLFLKGDFDAMVNYETLILKTNRALEAAQREPLYAVYPVDGLTIADSPLGFVSANGMTREEGKKEEIFLALQEYLLKEETQNKIQKTGRRVSLVAQKPDPDIFRPEWGIRTDQVLSTMNMPTRKVLFEAFSLYQTDFKKKAYNCYLLDYSGSMAGSGMRELMEALPVFMKADQAKENFLEASKEEVNRFYAFGTDVEEVGQAKGGGEDLELLYKDLLAQRLMGTTNLYHALDKVLNDLKEIDLTDYSPAIVIMTDGMATDQNYQEAFMARYAKEGQEIPIFGIMFGDAKEEGLLPLAETSHARVFDGRKNLLESFRAVRGYN